MKLEALRSYAVGRSLAAPVSLEAAVERLGFIQADPIRAPARAQDLTLRPRVVDYRAGDLERRYGELDIEEEYFVNYGFLLRRHVALLQPRTARRVWDRATRTRAKKLLEFVRAHGEVHPRLVEEHFALGAVVNDWGGVSNATTHLLDGMHFRGLLRVVRRDAGIRIYAPREAKPSEFTRQQEADALLALALDKYAPMPARSLGQLASRLRRSAPQRAREIDTALARAKKTLPHVRIDGVTWLWPEGEPTDFEAGARVRLLAPFDPVVWDRARFELFWNWAYRFEAYVPVAKRKLGYYALPLLWRDQVIGWGNLAYRGGRLSAELGYVAGKAPRERAFKPALEAELADFERFLKEPGRPPPTGA